MILDHENLRTVLVTDCGSTTTKAVLFEKTKDGWRQTYRGEAPTTVEEPVADVTVGALNAFREIQEISGRTILAETPAEHPFLLTSTDPSQGIDLYLSTSSAGGGLQMVVSGFITEFSLESANRAALGAGAIVLDAICADDGRADHERIQRIRHLKPDIFLLSGGADGGATAFAVEIAELLLAAEPRPRFGDSLKLPVVYAGNNAAAKAVGEILTGRMDLHVVENVRPQVEKENLAPARDAIHEVFLSHVMSHAPGYSKLLTWTPKPVLPTPSAFGDMVKTYAEQNRLQVMAVDIGGATTDMFSVFESHEDQAQIYNRTVSANLGMSYSVANVLLETGIDNIARWMASDVSYTEIKDRLRNKMIRPTTIPQTFEDLCIEHAVCREALRLSLEHHKSLASGPTSSKKARGIADIFSQGDSGSLVDMMALDLVIGSGGVLSHAPNRLSAALMMLDGFELSGVTELAVDSIFMMPHLGVLSSVDPNAANQVFARDCLIKIAVSIAPVFPRQLRRSELAKVEFEGKQIGVIKNGVVELVRKENATGRIRIEPLHARVDVGAGAGKVMEKQVDSGAFGVVLDGRNRPIVHSSSPIERQEVQKKIQDALGVEL